MQDPRWPITVEVEPGALLTLAMNIVERRTLCQNDCNIEHKNI